MIFGINVEMCLPDFQEEKENKQKKEIERIEILKSKIDKVLNESLTDKEKIIIQPYMESIFNFIRDNARIELISDKKLAKFIKIYYKVLMKENVELNEYLFLNSLLNNFSNEITETIISKYENYKNILVSFAIEQYNNQKNCNNSSLNEIIDKILNDYKNGNMEVFKYKPLFEKYGNSPEQTKNNICKLLDINSIEDVKSLRKTEIDAVSNLILIQSNTNLNLSPYLEENSLVFKKKNF